MMLLLIMNIAIVWTLLRRRPRSFRPHHRASQQSAERVRKSDIAVCRHLVLASLLYFLFNFPHYIWRCSQVFRKTVSEQSSLIDEMFQLLLTTQYCVHCFTYARVILMVSKLRRKRPKVTSLTTLLPPFWSRSALNTRGNRSHTDEGDDMSCPRSGRSRNYRNFESVETFN